MPQPKVGKIRNLGGHGPEFGADFSRPTPQYAPVSPGNRPQASRTMLYQVQQSLESKTGQYDPDSVITTPQYTPMRPHSQQFQSLLSEDSFQPQFSEPTPVYQSFASSVQSSYRPGPPEPEDEDYEIIPVSERKKAFMRAEPRKWGNQPQSNITFLVLFMLARYTTIQITRYTLTCGRIKTKLVYFMMTTTIPCSEISWK